MRYPFSIIFLVHIVADTMEWWKHNAYIFEEDYPKAPIDNKEARYRQMKAIYSTYRLGFLRSIRNIIDYIIIKEQIRERKIARLQVYFEQKKVKFTDLSIAKLNSNIKILALHGSEFRNKAIVLDSSYEMYAKHYDTEMKIIQHLEESVWLNKFVIKQDLSVKYSKWLEKKAMYARYMKASRESILRKL